MQTKLERFEELKTKGFATLKGEEREEYKTLLAESQAAKPKDQESKPNSDMVPKSEVQAMIDTAIANAKHQFSTTTTAMQGFEEYKAKPKAKPTATLRKWRKDSDSPFGYLIKSEHHSWDYDEDTRKHDKDIYKFTFLMDDDSTKEVLLPYLELTKMNEVEWVTILDMPKKVFVQDKWNGRKQYAFKRTVHKDGVMIEQNDEVKGDVELNVMMDGYPEGAKVEFGNGRIAVVPVNALNS